MFKFLRVIALCHVSHSSDDEVTDVSLCITQPGKMTATGSGLKISGPRNPVVQVQPSAGALIHLKRKQGGKFGESIFSDQGAPSLLDWRLFG